MKDWRIESIKNKLESIDVEIANIYTKVKNNGRLPVEANSELFYNVYELKHEQISELKKWSEILATHKNYSFCPDHLMDELKDIMNIK